MFKLDLSQEEVSLIIAAIGELPIKSNAFSLAFKIQGQVAQQSLKQSEETSEQAPVEVQPTEESAQ